MKPCTACQDTSPDDARFCITCGHAFVADAQTMRLENTKTQWVITQNGYRFTVGTVSFSLDYKEKLGSQ